MGICGYRVLFILCGAFGVLKANNDHLMFPYGVGNGDTALPAGDDTYTAELPLSKTFYFFDVPYNSLYVNMNGALSFVAPLSRYSPGGFPMKDTILFTPYWGDVDTRNGGTVMYREETEDPEALAMADNVIRQTFVAKQDFTSTWIFIATWDQVAFYGSTSDPAPVNTFQCVLVSGDEFSAVIFNYDVITWTTGTSAAGDAVTGLGGTAAQVGFNAGDGINFYAIPESLTADVINVTLLSNIGVPGRFVFEVDQKEIVDVSCTDSGDVKLYPEVTSMMGGTDINVAGPCFDVDNDQIKCKFGSVETNGTVVSQFFAKCVAPRETDSGHISFELSRDGGETYPYGSRVQVVHPGIELNATVFREDRSSPRWSNFDDGVILAVTWNTDALSSDVDSVNVVVYTYYEDRGTGQVDWNQDVVLAENVPFSDGRVNFTRPDVDMSTANVKLLGFVAVMEANPIEGMSARVLWSNPGDLQWLYPLDSVDWCRNWTALQLNDMEFLEDRPPCPCSLRQANRDFSRYFPLPMCREDQWGVKAKNCAARPGAYHCVVARNRSVHGAGQECCYDRSGVLLEDRLGDTGFGYTHRSFFGGAEPPIGPGNITFYSHFFDDIVPWFHCCKFPALDAAVSRDDAVASCARYGSVRPSRSCAEYRIPSLAAVYGTMHYITPDRFNYTFNGYGEYLILKTDDGRFILQGRMEQIAQNISASGLSAIAARLDQGDILHIAPSPSHVINVYIQHNDSYERLDNLQLMHWNLNGTIVEFNANISRDGVRVLFANGIGLHVKVLGTIMRFTLVIPQQHRGDAEGLLGNFNSDATDDLTLSDGTTLPSDSSMETIRDDFAPFWLIEDSSGESMFYYLPGYSGDTYSNVTHEHNYTAAATAASRAACEASAFCHLDYHLTGGVAGIALETLRAEEELAGYSEDFATDPTRCQELQSPANGQIAPESSYAVGGQLVFACDECYELVGESALTCLDTMTWDGEPGQCVAQSNGTCENPSTPANGTVELNACKRVASFSCMTNYTLLGQASITCDDDGSWAADFPLCESDVPDSTPTVTKPDSTPTVTKSTPTVTESGLEIPVTMDPGLGVSASEDPNLSKLKEKTANDGRRHLWWLIVAAGVAVGSGIIIVVVCRRKKNEK